MRKYIARNKSASVPFFLAEGEDPGENCHAGDVRKPPSGPDGSPRSWAWTPQATCCAGTQSPASPPAARAPQAAISPCRQAA